ncbi:hypothetical protein DYB34_014224, partial [Aphanomyces astaci]
ILVEAELGRCGYKRGSLDMYICVRQHNKFEGKWVKKANAHGGSTSDECAQLLQFRRLYARLEAEIAPAQADVANAPGLPCNYRVRARRSRHGQKTDNEQQEYWGISIDSDSRKFYRDL